jgi:hypothetical protein
MVEFCYSGYFSGTTEVGLRLNRISNHTMVIVQYFSGTNVWSVIGGLT